MRNLATVQGISPNVYDLYRYPHSRNGYTNKKYSDYCIADPAAKRPPYHKRKRSISNKSNREREILKQLNGKLLELYDELYHSVAGNWFYYDAVDALTAVFKPDVDTHCHLGMTLTSQWLREKEQVVLHHLEELRTWLQEELRDLDED